MGKGEEALKVADGSLARNLKRIIARQTAGELAGLPTEKTRQLESFDTRLRAIEDTLGSTDPLELGRRSRDQKLMKERDQLLRQREALLAELSSAYPRYSELVAPTPLEVASLQSVLGSDEMALLYYLGPRSFLFSVTPQELRYAEIAPASEINGLAERYNRALGSGKLNRSVALEPLEPKTEVPSLDEDTAALSRILLEPLRQDIELVGDRSLIIVPTQNLWMVPFESLPGLHEEKFLVQERSLSYSPSLSLLVCYRQLQRSRQSARSALVMGGAEYGDEVAPLPYAALEAEINAALGSDVQFNKAQPKGAADIDASFEEPGIYRLKCDVHPWMRTFVVTTDNPFYAVSGADGSFNIGKVPDGKYKIVAWHARYGQKEATVEIKGGAAVEANFSYDGSEKEPAENAGELTDLF
jgi:hypothetical protein